MSVDISVIICTRNRSNCLIRNLESLQNLKTSDGLTHEILLIDNGSTDKTRDVMNGFVEKNPEIYKYHFEPKEGKSNALNFGIQHARGKIIAFTDDDVIVDENWIQTLWDTFVERKEIIAVQGRILLQEQPGELPPWVDPRDLLFFPYYAPSPTPYYCDVLVGANMAFRREAFEKYGMFDPRLGPGTSAVGEETEFGMRLKDAGERIFYQPEALVFHEFQEHRLTWDYWCERQRQRAYSNAILDVLIYRRKVSDFANWRKLTRYYAKYFLHELLDNQQKRNKYDRRIRYQKDYMRFVYQLTKDTQKLTVCILTQNCTHKLIQAIESVLPVADEIVVVDGGSSDNTKDVACSFDKVRYYYHQWPDNFAVQYNYALDQAPGDWILRLDSDEAIGVNMRKKIRKLMRSRKHDLYIFPRYWIVQTDPLRYVKSKKLYPDYQQRLFRNLPRYRYDIGAKTHIRFTLEVERASKKVKDANVFHFDFVYNDRKAREEKVRVRNSNDPSSERTNLTHYLFEDYPRTIKKCREKLW